MGAGETEKLKVTNTVYGNYSILCIMNHVRWDFEIMVNVMKSSVLGEKGKKP